MAYCHISRRQKPILLTSNHKIMKTFLTSFRIAVPHYLLLAFFSLSVNFLFAETLSGVVYEECSRQPIAGAKISLFVNPAGGTPQSFNAITNQNGIWTFSFAGSDPAGLYVITLASPAGASSPGNYTHTSRLQSKWVKLLCFATNLELYHK